MTGSLSQTRGRPEPGRELDALIAERVMGIPIFNAADDGLPCVWIEEHTGESVAEYSTDIAAAFTVVEMATDYVFASTDFDHSDATSKSTMHRADLWFGKRGACSFGKAIAPTLPHAICLAALAALSPADDGGAR